MHIELQKLEDFNLHLQKSNYQPLLVKFSASWCSPCRKLQLEINKLLEEQPNLLFLEIDTKKFSSLAQRFKVQAVPTLLLFYKNNVKKKQGYMEFLLLKEFIKI